MKPWELTQPRTETKRNVATKYSRTAGATPDWTGRGWGVRGRGVRGGALGGGEVLRGGQGGARGGDLVCRSLPRSPSGEGGAGSREGLGQPDEG